MPFGFKPQKFMIKNLVVQRVGGREVSRQCGETVCLLIDENYKTHVKEDVHEWQLLYKEHLDIKYKGKWLELRINLKVKGILNLREDTLSGMIWGGMQCIFEKRTLSGEFWVVWRVWSDEDTGSYEGFMLVDIHWNRLLYCMSSSVYLFIFVMVLIMNVNISMMDCVWACYVVCLLKGPCGWYTW